VTLEEINEVLDQVAAASPLHGAAGNGHEAVMSLLLENGADIEMKEVEGGTPLAVAIDNGSEAVIKLLLAKGAKVDYLYWITVSEPGSS
jgi:ankyrin repeat protein